MRQYVELCNDILTNGEVKSNRTGEDTIGVFGRMMKFDLSEGFPILTTKKVNFDTVVDELLWFIRGGHNVNDPDAPKKIWDSWASPSGDLGRIYGCQWIDWRVHSTEQDENSDGVLFYYPYDYGINQIQNAIDCIKRTPNSRRNIVSAWNVGELEEKMISFPPCHVLFQFHVSRDRKKLNMCMYQRSADMALGVPFNISSYALLLSLFALECGMEPGVFIHFLADAHIYVNHIEKLKKQLERPVFGFPSLHIDTSKIEGNIVFNVRKEHISLINYQHHPFIRYEVAV